MESNTAQGYMIELGSETGAGIDAGRWLRGMAQQPNPPLDHMKWSFRVFAHVRVAVSCAAGVSRILWPSEHRGWHEKGMAGDEARACVSFRVERGEWLRSQLKIIDAEFPTLQRRAVRNAFEHADDRIDDISRSGVPSNVIDYAVYSTEFLTLQSPSPIEVVRRLDPETLILYFGPETVDLAALDRELAQVRHRVETWQADNGRPTLIGQRR